MMKKNNSDSWDVIKESHNLTGEPDKISQFYHKWSENYDKDVTNQNYCAPEYIASYFEDIHQQAGICKLNKEQVEILDAGCGTGLVGVELKKKGYRIIDGCDISQNMIEIAEKLKVYRSLSANVDLNDMDTFKDNQHDVVISCGVFTLGHVPPEALNEIVRITKTCGLVVISTRTSYYDKTNFQEVCYNLESIGKIEIVEHIIGPYIEEENAHYWTFKVN